MALFAACLTVLASWQTLAEDRVPEASGARTALVMGNGAYTGELPALRNPVNDARLMARTLREHGFQVTLIENAREDDMESAVLAFGEALRSNGRGGVGLFYYAGHGVQWRGGNYLIPVGTKVESERHLMTRTVSAEKLVLAEMGDAPTALNIVVLDACRDNPWATSGKRSIGGQRGLARMDVPTGSTNSFFLAYSAAAGQAADDGDGDNSTYTRALATAMGKPGLKLEDVFKEAGRQVVAATESRQVPWTEGSWYGQFFFAPPSQPAPKPVSPSLVVDAPEPDTEMWLQVRATNNVQSVERFLELYPDSEWRPHAEVRLDELRPPVPTRPPPPPYEKSRENGAEADSRPPQPATPPAPPRAAREVGERFRDCAMCPEVVVLPAGSYRMGSPAGQPGREAREGPAHEVTFAAPFAIGVYEVKVSEFQRFVEEAGYSAGSSCNTLEDGEYQERVGRSWRNPGFAQDGRHPVACVNWADAQAYVAWLSRKTGEGYRLPSEAEWEYAARADTTTVRYWDGAEADQCRFANGADASISDYSDDDTTAPCHDGYVKTSPVGSFAANSWGLADLLGNVLEWTADCWNSNYVGAPAYGNAWQDGDCTRRTLRGGAWISEPSRLRVADRRWPSDGAASRYDYFGFRVARTIKSKQVAPKQPLTVRTGPPDARVRIMNITARYQPGIKLPPGSYDVTVTANGFDKVERTLRHGDEPTNVWIGLPFRDCPVCPKMVEIPTGRYTMGTTRGRDRYSDEGPAHEVNVGSPIAVGMFEVSFAEWDACLADGGCKRHLKNEGTGRGPHPVSHANVEDAREYVKWLTFRTDRQYRLLSEAEWEYAARAGTESERHWQVAADQCLYENGLDLAIQTVAERVGLSGWADCTDGYVYAAPGEGTRLKPNPWGLYHMLGNVSEWTTDCWHPNYQGAPTDGSAWRDRSGECDNGQVVMRGGSWSSIPKNVRAPFRGGVGHDPTIGRVDVGFRVAAQITR